MMKVKIYNNNRGRERERYQQMVLVNNDVYNVKEICWNWYNGVISFNIPTIHFYPQDVPQI